MIEQPKPGESVYQWAKRTEPKELTHEEKIKRELKRMGVLHEGSQHQMQ